MTEKQDQRICIKFCFQLGKTSSETIQMMQKAFGNECMSKTQIKEWYNRFKEGRTSVDSDSRSGRPSTTKTLDKSNPIFMYTEKKNCVISPLFNVKTIITHFHFGKNTKGKNVIF